GDRFGRAHHAQRFDRRVYHVVLVRRAQALAQDVLDAGRLYHGAHRTTGDDARTRSSRAQQHLASTETTDAVVRDRGTQHRNLEQVLASLITALADGLWHLVGLAHADPDVPGFVADDHQGREAEPSPALH